MKKRKAHPLITTVKVSRHTTNVYTIAVVGQEKIVEIGDRRLDVPRMIIKVALDEKAVKC